MKRVRRTAEVPGDPNTSMRLFSTQKMLISEFNVNQIFSSLHKHTEENTEDGIMNIPLNVSVHCGRHTAETCWTSPDSVN